MKNKFIITLALLIAVGSFALFSFKEKLQVEESSYVLVVVASTELFISYGNGRNERIPLKSGNYLSNDNTTINALNKVKGMDYKLISTATAKDGAMYYVFEK